MRKFLIAKTKSRGDIGKGVFQVIVVMSLPSPLSRISHPLFKQHCLEVIIKRDDLIHPIISGNKWRKLAGNLAQAKQLGKTGILSFGGAYSNHIHALAYACYTNNFKALGVIRGEPHYRTNSTLSQVERWQMQLSFVDRATYRLRHEREYLAKLASEYPDYFIVPEGGSNEFALSGMAEVINELNKQVEFDTLITATGSGGTLAGLIAADNNQHQLIGIAVLKKAEYLKKVIADFLPENAKDSNNWQLETQYHRGGYGKFSSEDWQRISEFSQQTGIPFEPVYSGKMLLAFLDKIAEGQFTPGQRIVLLHTGGLQGLDGLRERGKLPYLPNSD